MGTVEFLVRFLPRSQNGAGSTDAYNTLANAADTTANASTSTGDAVNFAFILAAIVAVGIALCFAMLKKRRSSLATNAQHATSNRDNNSNIFHSNKALFIATGIIAALCLVCAFTFGGIKNAIADNFGSFIFLVGFASLGVFNSTHIDQF